MGIQLELNKSRVPVKIWTRDIEADAMQQLLNVASLPIVHGHVAAMPDVHTGIGATVGSVIPTRQAVIPAAVGVDMRQDARQIGGRLGVAHVRRPRRG